MFFVFVFFYYSGILYKQYHLNWITAQGFGNCFIMQRLELKQHLLQEAMTFIDIHAKVEAGNQKSEYNLKDKQLHIKNGFILLGDKTG